MIIAHRGYSARAPENTRAAFDLAIEANVHALEWDVQEASDGTPVIFHDYDLSRTTNGAGLVRQTSLEELKQLDAGSWMSREFAGEQILTVEEGLALARGRVRHVFCEIKAGLSEAAVRRVLADVDSASMKSNVTLMSFDWWLLQQVRTAAPEVRLGFLVDTPGEFHGAVLRAVQAGHAIVDCNARLVLRNPDYLAFARSQGVDVVVYTVDDVEQARALQDAGVHGVTTNVVETMMGLAS